MDFWTTKFVWKLKNYAIKVKQQRCVVPPLPATHAHTHRPSHSRTNYSYCFASKVDEPIASICSHGSAISLRSNQKYFTQRSVVWLKCNFRLSMSTKSILEDERSRTFCPSQPNATKWEMCEQRLRRFFMKWVRDATHWLIAGFDRWIVEAFCYAFTKHQRWKMWKINGFSLAIAPWTMRAMTIITNCVASGRDFPFCSQFFVFVSEQFWKQLLCDRRITWISNPNFILLTLKPTTQFLGLQPRNMYSIHSLRFHFSMQQKTTCSWLNEWVIERA